MMNVVLHYQGYYSLAQWNDPYQMYIPPNIMVPTWPLNIRTDSFSKMIKLLLINKVLSHDSIVEVPVFSFNLLFKVELSDPKEPPFNYNANIHTVVLASPMVNESSNNTTKVSPAVDIQVEPTEFVDFGNKCTQIVQAIRLSLGSTRAAYQSHLISGERGSGKSYSLHVIESKFIALFHDKTEFKIFHLSPSNIRGSNNLNDLKNMATMGIEELAVLFLSLFTVPVSSEPTALNKTGSYLLLLDDIDAFLLVNKQPKDDLNGLHSEFTNTEEGSDTALNMSAAAAILRQLLYSLSDSRIASDISPFHLFIVGTTCMAINSIPHHTSGAPEFGKVWALPRPTFEERYQLVCTTLTTWQQACDVTYEALATTVGVGLPSVVVGLPTATNDSSNTADMEVREWSRRVTGLTRGYLPADITSVLNALKKKHLQSLPSNEASNCVQWRHAIAAVGAHTPHLLRGLRTNASAPVYAATDIAETSYAGSMHPTNNSGNNRFSWSNFGGYRDVVQKLTRIVNRIAGQLQRETKEQRSAQQIYHLKPMTEILTRDQATAMSTASTQKPQQTISSSEFTIGGIVLHGPSGCGKTFLAHIIAAEACLTLVSVRCTELLSPYFSQTESTIRDMFLRARGAAPCALLFDDFDSIACTREQQELGGNASKEMSSRVLSTFLNELDGVSSNTTAESRVLVLVTCTDIRLLDPALLRPGRLQHHCLLGSPSKDDLRDILRVKWQSMAYLCFEDVNLDTLMDMIKDTDVSHGAAVNGWFNRAKLVALRTYVALESNSLEGQSKVTAAHFVAALRNQVTLDS